MFGCVGGFKYWPLTGSAAFLKESLSRVTTSMIPTSSRAWSQVKYETLDDALTSESPFAYLSTQCKFAIQGKDGWVVVLDSGFPTMDINSYMSDEALAPLRCEYLGYTWVPETEGSLPAASFISVLPHVGFSGIKKRGDRRWVQVSDQGGSGWDFSASGSPRSFEKLAQYSEKSKLKRLTLPTIALYITAAGVPAEDDLWLRGPVVVARRRTPYPPTDNTWSTLTELRRRCGYPDATIPSKLRSE